MEIIYAFITEIGFVGAENADFRAKCGYFS
jgi:hypothetical protein